MSKVAELKNELTGWSALDLDNPALGALRAEQQEHIKQLNSDMRELFLDSELGMRVLRTLMDWTIKRPAVSPLENERIDVWRGGQNDIVLCILKAIENSEIGAK